MHSIVDLNRKKTNLSITCCNNTIVFIHIQCCLKYHIQSDKESVSMTKIACMHKTTWTIESQLNLKTASEFWNEFPSNIQIVFNRDEKWKATFLFNFFLNLSASWCKHTTQLKKKTKRNIEHSHIFSTYFIYENVDWVISPKILL